MNTPVSYELCLRLALIYPLAAFFIVWMLGGSGEFGGLRVFPELRLFPEDSDDVARIIIFFGFILLFWLFLQTQHSSDKKSFFYFAIVLVVIFMISAFAFADTGAFDYIKKHYNATYLGTIGFWVIFNLFYLTASVSILVLLSSENVWFAPLVFLCILPLINAFIDWLSLGFTRGFLYAIYQRTHSGWKTLLFVGLDFILALLFLVTITSTTVLLFAGVNALSLSNGRDVIINLTELINGLNNHFWALDYLWIHFMMLSTLIPTLIHFTVAASATILVVPNKWRDSILKHWNDRGDARFGAFLYVSNCPHARLSCSCISALGPA